MMLRPTFPPFSGPRLLRVLLCLSLHVSISVSGQSPLVENQVFECIRQSFVPNGASLDSLMLRYEAQLIEMGLLQSGSAPDYQNLIQRVASGQRIETPMPLQFGTALRELSRDSLAWRDCQFTLERYRTQNPESTVSRFMDRRDVMIVENIGPDVQAAALLDILGPPEFGLPFYRMETYYLLDLLSRAAGQPGPLPDPVSEQAARYDGRGANVFRIYLNEETQTLVEDRLVSPVQLGEMVHRHAREFGPEALYVVDLEMDVKYRQFILLRDQITLAVSEVRDQYARRVFGKTLSEVTEAESLLLEERFPVRVVSP